MSVGNDLEMNSLLRSLAECVNTLYETISFRFLHAQEIDPTLAFHRPPYCRRMDQNRGRDRGEAQLDVQNISRRNNVLAVDFTSAYTNVVDRSRSCMVAREYDWKFNLKSFVLALLQTCLSRS